MLLLGKRYRELQSEHDELKAQKILHKKARVAGPSDDEHEELAIQLFTNDLDRAGKKFSVMFAPWHDPSLWKHVGTDLDGDDRDLFTKKQLGFKDLLTCLPENLHAKMGNITMQRLVC